MTKLDNKNSYRDSHTQQGYSGIYTKTYREGYYFYQWEQLEKPFLKKIFLYLKEQGKNNYCDFACGTGRILKIAEDFFNHTTGIDISSEMLKVAKKDCPKSTLICEDITVKPINKKFDIITSFRFFLHAENNLRKEALKKLNQCLEKDGYLIVNIHVNNKSILGILYKLKSFFTSNTGVSYSYEKFKTLLEQEDFRIEKVFWYSYLPRLGWHFNTFYALYLKRFDSLINKLPFVPKRWSQSFIIVARKN